MAKINELSVWLNEHKVSRKNLIRKVRKQNVISHVVTGSVVQPERMEHLLWDDIELLQMTKATGANFFVVTA